MKVVLFVALALVGLAFATSDSTADLQAACRSLENCACVSSDTGVGCGYCGTYDSEGTFSPDGPCQAGNINTPLLDCAEGQAWESERYATTAECEAAQKQGAAAAIIGAVVPSVVVLVSIIVWWCLRGRFWWRSTSHKRCLCDEDACCAKTICLKECCHPYEAHPPPHTELMCSGDGRKSQAIRVAPFFPHNICAWCSNIEGYDEEAHPCGFFGCGHQCNWVPGCICWLPPRSLMVLLCEDVTSQDVLDEAGCGCCGCGGNSKAKESKKSGGRGGMCPCC